MFEIVFESERITFVKITNELVHEYLEMVNDESVQRSISNKIRTYTLEMEYEWIEKKLATNFQVFSMIEKKTNEFIGNIEIRIFEDNHGELGIAITPRKQNNHFGQESIQAIIKYAFETLKVQMIDLHAFDFNQRAIHCYQKVGFEIDPEGKDGQSIHMIYKGK